MNQESKVLVEKIVRDMMEVIDQTKVIGWLEKNFEKVGKDGRGCRTLLAVALLKECDKEKVSELLKIKPHAASIYLKELKEKDILERRSGKQGRLFYSPKLTDETTSDKENMKI